MSRGGHNRGMSDPGGARASMHGALVERLGRAIVDGAYAPGDRLLTTELAVEVGASRSTAREAVRVLESLGLVQVRRKAGIEVRPTDEWQSLAPEVIAWRLAGASRARQLEELSELRSAIEPLAVRLAVGRASEPERRALVAAAMRMAEHSHDADGEAYLSADVEFHETLLAASGNALLVALAGVVGEVLAGRTRHALMPADANPDAVRWHRDVAFAIAEGDASAAEAAMTRIVAEAEDAMRRSGSGSAPDLPEA